MDNRIFGVRPYPETGESYAGYFLRLAWLNGLPHLKSLFETIGMERPNERNIGRWDALHLKAVCDKLAPFLNRTTDQVYEPLQVQNGASVVYDHTRMIQDLRVSHPRICPACLAEGRYIHQPWGLAVIAHCQHHNCMLLDHCPQCAKPFTWKTSLFEGCDHCGLTWTEYISSQRIVTALEKQIVSQLEHDEYDRDLIKDLCAAIVIAARPFDSMHQAVGSVGSMAGYSTLVSQAYKLLQSRETQVQWLQACQRERSGVAILGESALLRPFFNLRKNLSRHTIAGQIRPGESSQSSSDEWAPCERTELIKPYRLKGAKSDEAVLRYQVTLHELAVTLDIPSSEIQALVDGGAISATNTTTVLRDQLFDLRSLAMIMQKLPILDEQAVGSQCLVHVTTKSWLFEEHLTTFGELLSDVITGRVRCYVDEGRTLSSLFIEEEDLQVWLNYQLSVACQAPVAIHRAARSLRCGHKRVRELVQAGKLSWAKWSQNGERVDGSLLFELLKTSANAKARPMEGETHA